MVIHGSWEEQYVVFPGGERLRTDVANQFVMSTHATVRSLIACGSTSANYFEIPIAFPLNVDFTKSCELHFRPAALIEGLLDGEPGE